jgi:hypothetical protein
MAPETDGMIQVSSVPAMIGATSDQVRYWLTLLGVKARREGRVSYIAQATIDMLTMVAALVHDGVSPKEAAHRVMTGGETIAQPSPVVASPPARVEDTNLAGRMESMERALLAVVEELKASRQESAAIRAEVIALREENQVFRQVLLPAPGPVRVVEPWRPVAVPDPLAGASWLTRAWVELTDPARLRRFDS